jgi:hypothetical protein
MSWSVTGPAHLRVMDTSTALSGLEPLLTIEVLSEYLDMPVTTIRDWQTDGKGLCVTRIGGRVRLAVTDVQSGLATSGRPSQVGDLRAGECRWLGPAHPIGKFGEIHFEKASGGRARAFARIRDHKANSGASPVTAETPKGRAKTKGLPPSDPIRPSGRESSPRVARSVSWSTFGPPTRPRRTSWPRAPGTAADRPGELDLLVLVGVGRGSPSTAR